MLQDHVLSLLIFLPLLMAALVAILPGKFGASYRWVSLGVTIIQSVLVIMMLLTFSLTQGAPNTIDSFQFVERTSWFSLNLGSLGYLQAEYFLGTDGLSITLVALNAIIMLISTIASFIFLLTAGFEWINHGVFSCP